jgi:hypothetical protein
MTSFTNCCYTQLIWRDADYTSAELLLGRAAVGVHGTKGEAHIVNLI